MLNLGASTTGLAGNLDLIITLGVTATNPADSFRTNLIVVNVPEPSTAALLGFAALLACRRRRLSFLAPDRS